MTMVHIEGLGRLIREHPFFQGLDESSLALLEGCARNERHDAGTLVFHEGEKAERTYLIRSGQVNIEIHRPGREPCVVETLHEGEVLGWSWLLEPPRWSFDARAITLTRLVSLDATCLRAKMDADHEFGYQLFWRYMPVMARRLSAARLQLSDLYGSPSQRGKGA